MIALAFISVNIFGYNLVDISLYKIRDCLLLKSHRGVLVRPPRREQRIHPRNEHFYLCNSAETKSSVQGMFSELRAETILPQ